MAALASSASSSAQAPSFTPDALPAVTVPSGPHDALELGQRFERWSRADARPCSTDDRRRPSSAAIVTGVIFGAKCRVFCARDRLAAGWRSAHASWSARLIVVVGGDVLGGLGHRVDAVLRLHQRIDEAPADGGVVDRRCARTRCRPWPSRTARGVMLSTPPAIIRPASPDLIARAAVPTASMPEPHRRLMVAPRHFVRQAGQQQRHARDVAVVFAGLVGAAVDHVVDRGPVDVGIARHQRAQRDGAEVVGAHILAARRRSGRRECGWRRR